jgi:hypothetical protein
MRYQVETYFWGDEWENTWSEDGQPLTFATYVEAVEALIDHLAAHVRAHRAENTGQPLGLDEYRIVPCDQPDSWEPIILPEDFAV